MTDEANLERLREQSRITGIAIAKSRDEVIRCVRETSEVRIAAALKPESSSPKEVEARCKKLDNQRTSAQAEIDKLLAEAEVFDAAIQHIETELLPKLHAGRLEKQRNTQEAYRNVARRILAAANLLAELNAEARAIFVTAQSDFPREEIAADQDLVHIRAGLDAIWDNDWIGRDGNMTRRDMFVRSVLDWDGSLVDETDPVAKVKRYREEQERKRCEEIERERRCADTELAEALARGASPAKSNRPEPQTGNWRF
jgi:hypothetical protein